MVDAQGAGTHSQPDLTDLTKKRKTSKHGASTTRRRCRMACIACRNRKVRCDVEQGNSPCTNCRLDQEACIVQNRVRQSKIAYQQNFNLSTPEGVAAWSALQKSIHHNKEPPAFPNSQELENTHIGSPDLEDAPTVEAEFDAAIQSPHMSVRDGPGDKNTTLNRTNDVDSAHRRGSISEAFNPGGRSEIGHYYYPFLMIERVSQLPLTDLQYLESLSCFQIPVRHLLDEIVRAYFLYVHPHLPILNEADFWRMYSGEATGELKISLFVFHAMISTACGFVPETVVRQLGFSNIRSARNDFYRRAKSLFYMDTNRDIISSAQGALILTYYVTNSDGRLNTYWLSNAICFARLAVGPSHLSLHAKSKEGTTLRRLWWCCQLRDRIMSVALRRSVHISPEEHPCPDLEEEDICWELENSKVYDWKTKQELLASFMAFCDLVVILADITVFLSTVKMGSRETSPRYQPQICSQRLDEWLRRTKTRLRSNDRTAESVQLHNNVLYIYYHASHAALWNHAIYTSVVEKIPLHTNLSEGRMRLESALRGIDESLKNIQEVGLLHCMPLAISAFIALPMVWHIMSTKLSRGNSAIEARSRLSFYFSAMNAFKTRSESTDAVLSSIRQLVSCFRAAEHATPDTRSKIHPNTQYERTPDNWTDVLTNQPQYFIRSTLTVELALSRGQYPVEADFPTALTSGAKEQGGTQRSQEYTPAAQVECLPRPGYNQRHEPLPGSETPAMWSLGMFEAGLEGLDSRQAQLQDVLSRFENADYSNSGYDFMPFQSPATTDSSFFNEMMSYLECA